MLIAAACERIFRLFKRVVAAAVRHTLLVKPLFATLIVAMFPEIFRLPFFPTFATRLASAETVTTCFHAPLLVGQAAFLIFFPVVTRPFSVVEFTAFATECFQIALENYIFTQLTLKRTVHHRQLDRRRESDSVEMLTVIANYPGVVALEHILKFRADQAVETFHVVG